MPKPRNRDRGVKQHGHHKKPQEAKSYTVEAPTVVDPQAQYLDFVEDNWSYEEAFSFAQRGLPYGSNFADYVSVTVLPPSSPEFINELQALYKNINQLDGTEPPSQNKSVIIAFSLDYWNSICAQIKRSSPKSQKPADWHKNYYIDNVHVLFQIKKSEAADSEVTEKVISFLKKWELGDSYNLTQGSSQEYLGVKNALMGGRFDDGIQVCRDPYTFLLQTLIGYEDPEHLGGSFVIAQKIAFNWDDLHRDDHNLEYIMGRDYIENGSDVFSQKWSPNSHIRHSRVRDENGNSIIMARQSKPYFEEQVNMHYTDKIQPNTGLFFIGYANSAEKIAAIVKSQIGNKGCPHFNDHFLKYLTPILGGILFIPNIQDLGLMKVNIVKAPSLEGEEGEEIKVYSNPLGDYHQVDWLRDFKNNQDVSSSPYLFLGRSHYMQVMSTYDPVKFPDAPKDLMPPSPRIMRLLSKTFNLWQDTWYFDRKQQEMKHLKNYITELGEDPTYKEFLTQIGDTENLASVPFALRSGLAMYTALGHVVSTQEYGCRGTNSEGKNGANTFHLQPEDLLAGGTANNSFGQGKYLVNYLTAEQRENFWFSFNTLTNHSGVGHVVPFYEEILEVGLEQVIISYRTKKESFNEKLNGCEENERSEFERLRNFYFSTQMALTGIQRYILNYAELANSKLTNLSSSQKATIRGMETLRDNLLHISKEAPTNLAQGLQLVLTVYIALQLTGEPVSIGRMDYVLRKFDPVNEQDQTEAQDLVDCFFIKVGEKVMFNRNFFDNHQYWGNIAMGGGGSGAYPQGPSFSQWGQQITLGGTDPETGDVFYNNLTTIFLRAGRRIPVNAPCLGLRVRSDTPVAILEEAAKSILSGGAQPIILNDDKVIDGLVKSGGYAGEESVFKQKWEAQSAVPFSKWKSEVDIKDARDYTTDGCHEYLFVGKTWFCISGGPLLTPLEFVLNEGRDFLSSGPQFIHGKRCYYQFKQISEYKTYEDLEDAYIKIFRNFYNQGANGHLGGYGNITSICPGTLINAFLHGSREKGADLYQNGARYNIFAPQYTGMANLVNAMWNIKALVYEKKMINLQSLREILINNWGKDLVEPFVPIYLPKLAKGDFVNMCTKVRQFVINEPKFGLSKEVSEFGFRLLERVSKQVYEMFADPIPQFLGTMQRLAGTYTSETNPTFGFQITPGGATFENYEDAGKGLGPSFDGRLRGETLASDSSVQNYLMDFPPKNEVFLIQDVLNNYREPGFWSGSILDLNIDEDYPLELLIENLKSFASGKGPNGITITVCDRAHMEEALQDTEHDLLRFRMGGWSEYAVAMFPNLMNQHIHRIRYGPKRIIS